MIVEIEVDELMKTDFIPEVKGRIFTLLEEDIVGITRIGKRALRFCTSLTSVVIPDSITSIDRNAFRGCAIKDVTTSTGLREEFFYPKDKNTLMKKVSTMRQLQAGSFSNLNIESIRGHVTYCSIGFYCLTPSKKKGLVDTSEKKMQQNLYTFLLCLQRLTNIWVLSNDRSRTLPPIPVDLVSNIFTFKKTSKYICDISDNGVGKPKLDRNSKCTFITQLRGSSL